MNFGSYDIFSTLNLNSTGTISVTCNAKNSSYTLAISAGSGTYAVRRMASGSHSLNYNLYTNSTRTTIWGDGSAGTVRVSGNGTANTHTVYGSIPARQNAYVGSYSDRVVVTLSF